MKHSLGKRMLAALLCIPMAFALAGCAKPAASSSGTGSSQTDSASSAAEQPTYYNKEGYPICNTKIEVTCSGPNDSAYDWNATMFKEQMRDRMGIDITFSKYSSEEWKTQLSLMVNSDRLTDLICGASIDRSQMEIWGDEGYFLDLNKYADLMPNMQKLFNEEPALRATFTTSSGAIYGLNQINRAAFSNVALVFINNVWLKNVGMKTPTNTDELYEALKAFRDQDANGNGDASDELPMVLSTGTAYAIERTLMEAFGVYSSSSHCSLQVMDGGKVELRNTSENYKEFLKYMHKLYAEGLMDAESYIQSNDQLVGKGGKDLVGMYGGNEPAWLKSTTQAEDVNWDALLGLASPVDSTHTIVKNSGITGNVRMAISAKTEYPEALCRLFDYFYTDEGRVETRYGYEGKSFEWVSDDIVGGKAPKYISDPNDPGLQYRYIINYGFDVNFVTNKFDACAQIDYDKLTDDQFKKLTADAYGWVAPVYKAYNRKDNVVVDAYPNVSYTKEEATERSTLFSDVANTIKSYKVAFITGESNLDTDWNTFVSEVERSGAKRLVEIEQAAYDRYAKNLK